MVCALTHGAKSANAVKAAIFFLNVVFIILLFIIIVYCLFSEEPRLLCVNKEACREKYRGRYVN